MSAPHTALLEHRYARSERMIGRDVGGEFILVPLAGRGADLDSVFNLNGVATFIWQNLDGQSTGKDVVDALVERFEVKRAQAEEDYLTLIGQLLEIDAVRRL
jgi:hypothetical protein